MLEQKHYLYIVHGTLYFLNFLVGCSSNIFKMLLLVSKHKLTNEFGMGAITHLQKEYCISGSKHGEEEAETSDCM